MVLRLLIVSHLRLFTSTLLALFALAPQHLSSQTWTPAGQMIGPLMWEFPLSLPDGTHLIPLRWVNARRNDSLYWFDIKSFTTTPKTYERQTPELNSVSFVGDFDTDGVPDVFGHNSANYPIYLFSALTTDEHIHPPVSGRYGIKTEIENRYYGDVDGDGLNDDYIAESEHTARIVYGDRNSPFIGPSYVELFDNSREIYPDLPPTKVAAVGMLSGKPCIVQSYQVMPDTPPFYELHELNIDDLHARASKIRTRLVQKLSVGENRRYGNVVLRTRDVWWLFSVYGSDSSPNGLKITRSSITLEPVSRYWAGGFQQYFGQGGSAGEENDLKVMDGEKPFLREDYVMSEVEGIGRVRHAVFNVARLVDAESAEVEIFGSAYPFVSQCQEAYATRMVLVPDIDDDRIEDFMVTVSFWDTIKKQYQNSVSLYLTSQRSTVSLNEDVLDSTKHVIDQGESWRIVSGISCSIEPFVSANIYNVSGAVVATALLSVNGTDLMICYPKILPTEMIDW